MCSLNPGVKGLSENISPTYSSENYVGRSEPVYMYQKAERDISFQVASNQRESERAVVSFPLKNGQGYAFCRDLNTLWRHGVPQIKIQQECGRISIIAWGWIDQVELN